MPCDPNRAMRPQQCADAVLMVRPQAFGYNPETAATNTFQKDDGAAPDEVQALASEEFDAAGAGACRRGGRGVRRGGLGRVPTKPDARVSQQLGELPRGRNAGAVPAAGREPPRRAPAGGDRRGGEDARLQGDASPRSHASRGRGAFPRGHRQPGARSRAARRLRLCLAAHAPGAGARMGARAWLRAAGVRGHEPRRRAALSHERAHVHRRTIRRDRPRRRSRGRPGAGA